MTRLEALKELAKKVEAGTLDWNYCGVQHVHGIGMNKTMWEAYQGSLDAAMALHEAVLPEFKYMDLLRRGSCHTTRISRSADEAEGCDFTAVSSVLPRALLLSILRALIAQEEST